jgi:hypothetical protein
VITRARTTPAPPPPLDVPADIAAQLADAAAEGEKRMAEWLKTHVPVRDDMIARSHIQVKVGWPPVGREERAELKRMHEIARNRTEADTKAANWYSESGTRRYWRDALAEYSEHVPVADARRAARLLNDSFDIVSGTHQIAKGNAQRKRPYETDPTLPLAVPPAGSNPSFPSGHAASSFGAATVLSELLPERRDEFLKFAARTAYSRVYGGVHYPSDVARGAFIGTAMARYAIERQRKIDADESFSPLPIVKS